MTLSFLIRLATRATTLEGRRIRAHQIGVGRLEERELRRKRECDGRRIHLRSARQHPSATAGRKRRLGGGLGRRRGSTVSVKRLHRLRILVRVRCRGRRGASTLPFGKVALHLLRVERLVPGICLLIHADRRGCGAAREEEGSVERHQPRKLQQLAEFLDIWEQAAKACIPLVRVDTTKSQRQAPELRLEESVVVFCQRERQLGRAAQQQGFGD